MNSGKVVAALGRITRHAGELVTLVVQQAGPGAKPSGDAYERRTLLWRAICREVQGLDRDFTADERERAAAFKGGN